MKITINKNLQRGDHDPLVPHFSLEIISADGKMLVNNHNL
jgi:hypothetical protein